MKKNLKKALAIMLALLLTGSAFADYYVSARADNPVESIAADETGGRTGGTASADDSIMPLADDGGSTSGSQDWIETGIEGFKISSFEVKMNGEPLEDADYVYSGAEIELIFNWELADTVRADDSYKPGPFPPQTLEIDINSLDLMGIELSDIPETDAEPLWFRGETVGKYYLQGNKIYIVIENENVYQHETDRIGGISFKGIIEKDDDVTQDGQEKEIGLGTGTVLKPYYLTDKESSVGVNKSLVGDLDAKLVNGEKKYYQTYKVTVKAENGTVHKIDLTDTPSISNSLTNPTDVRIEIHRADGSSETRDNYASLKKAFEDIETINDLYMGEYIDIYYTMEVRDDIFDKDVNGYGNTVSGKYFSNRAEDVEDPEKRNDTGTGSAWIWVSKPEINKEGLGYEVRDGKGYVKWRITIKLNDLYDEDITSLKDYIEKVVDIPGDKFVKPSQGELELSRFTDEGNGVFTCEYELEVTKDVFDSLVNEQVSNKVEVTFKDIDDPYEREGSYTIERTNASIVKTLADHKRVETPEEGMLLTWKIEVSDIPEGIEGFTINDYAGYSNDGGEQTLLTKIWLTDSLGYNNVLVVQGIDTEWGSGHILHDGAGIIKSVQFGTNYISDLTFEDEYIEKIAKANGTVTIQVQTLITQDTIGHEYGNNARVKYKDPNTNTEWESAESRDIFRDKENLLTKTGTVIEEKNAVAYTIKVMVPFLEITEFNKQFIITDDLPKGLSVDTSTITVRLTDQWNNVLQDVPHSYDVTGQKLEVKITATQSLVTKIQGYPNGSSNGYYLVVNFTAAVEDQTKFLEDGKTVRYENSASGTYNGKTIGEDTASNELTPTKMVEKKGEYDKDSAPYAKYTVHVNRGGITLLNGKASLTAVDQLGSALTFVDDDNHTVKVYEVFGSGTEDWVSAEELDANQYSYQISDDKRTLTFTKLPDGKHLRIEYWAYVDFENVTTLDETNASNDFMLQGYSSEQSKGGSHFSGPTFTPKGYVSSKVGTITLYKFWTNGGDKVALEGSVFQLKKMRIDEDGKLVEDDTNGPALIRDEIKITDDNRKEAGKIEIDKLPVNQILALVEIEADEGYSLGAPYYFVVDRTTTIDSDIVEQYNIKSFVTGDTLEYENRPTDSAWIKIAKTWEETDTKMLSWDKIKGSLKFEIKNAQNRTIRTLTGEDLIYTSAESDGTTRHVSAEIPVALGTYTVVETNSTIKDFSVATTYVIEAGNKKTQGSGTTSGGLNLQTADEGVTVVYTNTYSYTGTFAVKVSKRSLTGSAEISGASFKLSGGSYGSEGFTWTSGEAPYENKPYEFDLEPGVYTLEEIQAPKGYKRETGIIKFKVEKSGNIEITAGTEKDNKVGDDTVVMRDEPLDVEVNKIAIVGGDAQDVGGAILTLYDSKDLDKDYKLLPGHEALYEWPSKVGEREPIGGYLYASGDKRTYVLVETKVPESGGYGYSKKIEFKVRETGEIYDVKYVDGSEADTDDTTKGTRKNRILMEDKVISIKLSKVDLEGHTIEDEATISVYKKSDIDTETGNPLPNRDAIETFVFNRSSVPHDFGSKLQPGVEYVFVEEETGVPGGYERADYIAFKVEEDGSVKVYGDVDFDRNRDAYLMYNAEEGKQLARLVIRKTIDGPLTLEELKGGLTFCVEKISGEGDSYGQHFFTIAEDFEEENGKYVLRLSNLPTGTYQVTEIYKDTTPNGMNLEVSYTINNGQKKITETGETEDIDLTQDGSRSIVDYTNKYTYKMGAIKLTKSVKFVGTKLDWDTQVASTLQFRIFEVTDPNGPVTKEIAESPVSGSLLKWSEQDGVYEYELPVRTGTYIVKEECDAILGYERKTTYTVAVGEDDPSNSELGLETSGLKIEEGETTTVAYDNQYVKTYPVSISKQDITGQRELDGATLIISALDDGSEFKDVTWKSDGKTHLQLQLRPGKYKLTEETAPRGYKKTEEINFRVDDKGDIYIITDLDTGAEKKSATGTTVIMQDAPLDVEVDKVELGMGPEVEGAVLALYDKEDLDKDPNAEPLASNESKAGEVWQIGEWLEIGKTYVLVETNAPDGYTYSVNIEFTVDEKTGNIKDVKYTEGTGTVNLGDTKNGAAGTTPNNKIYMEDGHISIKLNKVDLDNTTEELDGAVIEIYYAEDVNANGRKKKPETLPLETWISQKGEIHTFGESLQAGRKYVFVEKVAPEGYQLATSIFFTIDKYGKVTDVTTVTNGEVKKTKDEDGDIVYLMEDAISSDPSAKLVLTKSVSVGEGIEPAGNAPMDITKVNLRFHVESIGLNPVYNDMFYVGSGSFKWDSNRKKYVQNIPNLTPGRYKITELWDDPASTGIVCTGQSWEMVLASASDESLGKGNGAATGPFELEDGDIVEVNFTNTYERAGTLVITKTIEGAVTKEEVEGTLKFIVTDNATKKSETYTLKDDFVYDEETKMWSKELTEVAGGYTVQESVTASSGKTYIAKYTVNGEPTPKNSKKAGDVVEVKPGGTTTVAYTNTYSMKPSSSGKDRIGGSSGGDDDSDDTSVLAQAVSTVTAALTRTGDRAPLGMWAALFVCGGAGMTVAGVAMKRRRKKN